MQINYVQKHLVCCIEHKSIEEVLRSRYYPIELVGPAKLSLLVSLFKAISSTLPVSTQVFHIGMVLLSKMSNASDTR